MPALDEGIHEVRADEPGATSYQHVSLIQFLSLYLQSSLRRCAAA